MDTNTVFLKTEKGEEEVQTRNYGLPLNLRHILIIVDGSSNVEKLLEKGAGLPNVAQSLEDLERKGFIAVKERGFGEIKAELIQLAKQTLGADAAKVIKKIQEAPNSREGLQSVVDNCHKLVKLIIDEKKADELKEKCRKIIQ